MAVNSLYYLVFLLGLYVIYYGICPLKYRWLVLLAGNLFFYVAASAASPIFLLMTGGCIWLAGMALERQRNGKVLAGAILFCLSFLLVLKYGPFFVRITNRFLASLGIRFTVPKFLASLGIRFTVPKFLVPLGISYYTLIAIGYLMDVYKKKIPAEKNFLKLMLFLSFFPQMSQGPFSRYKQLSGQLLEGHRWNYESLSRGCQRMLWGFFKKMVIADKMQPMLETIFAEYGNYGGPVIFLACVYMTVWMYADFSGYMDIVAGTAELFGIRLEENFKRPFFSKNLAEYWRRWHITLCAWFRDYLFYPLAVSKPAVKFGKLGRKWCGVRVGKLFPSLFALSFVWFSTGFWHAASIRYILWGVANGVFIMGAMVLEPYFKKMKKVCRIREASKGWKIFCTVRTFLLVSFLKVFPGAVSTKDLFALTGRMFTNFQLPDSLLGWVPGFSMEDLIVVAGALLLVFLVDLLEEKKDFRNILAEKPVAVRWICYGVLLVLILCVGEFGIDMEGGFAYAQY